MNDPKEFYYFLDSMSNEIERLKTDNGVLRISLDKARESSNGSEYVSRSKFFKWRIFTCGQKDLMKTI